MNTGDGLEENRKIYALRSFDQELSSTLKVLAALRDFQVENSNREWAEFRDRSKALSEGRISQEEYMELTSVPHIDVFIRIFRVLFPEIEYFGNCLVGKSAQSIGAVGFIKKYFTQVNPEYGRKGALVWALYRNSPIHQGSQTRKITYRGKSISTSCSIGSPERHLIFEDDVFSIDIPTLIEDFEKSVILYKDDISKDDQMVLTYFKYVFSLIERPDNFDLVAYQHGNRSWFTPEDLIFLEVH